MAIMPNNFLWRNFVQNDLSVVHLISNASLFVQIIMLILLAMLLTALFLFGKKKVQFARLNRKFRHFDRTFWSSSNSMPTLYNYYSKKNPESVEALFVDGYAEFSQFLQRGTQNSEVILHNCRRAMEASLNRELKAQNKYLDLLATFGSSAPYIGLLGTVYGIMSSFIALGGQTSVSIATVAPGIAEALIATAIGLLAAIPSVLFYNYFITQSQNLVVEYESFVEEFSNLIQRHIIVNQEKLFDK